MMIIDAHQHVWNPRRAAYDWLGPDLAELDRPIGMDEVRPSLARAGIDATVLVQSADNAEDTALMLDTAADAPEVAGIVVWLPLDRADDAARQLDALRRHPLAHLIVGVRNLIHDRPDPDWLLRPEVGAGLALLEREGLPFDLVAVLPRHLELVPILSERHPDLRLVIDHLAKPPIGTGVDEPWRTLIRNAASNPNVFAKVSGLYSAAGAPGDWTVDAIRGSIDTALEVFGPARLMYGGDWPISVTAGGYDRVWDGLAAVLSGLDAADQALVYGEVAQSFYALDAARLPAPSRDRH